MKLLLGHGDAADIGRNAEVRLFAPGVPNPTREDAEAWVHEKEEEADAEVAKRHRQVYRITVRTLVIAVIAAIAGIVAAWPIVKPWLAT